MEWTKKEVEYKGAVLEWEPLPALRWFRGVGQLLEWLPESQALLKALLEPLVVARRPLTA